MNCLMAGPKILHNLDWGTKGVIVLPVHRGELILQMCIIKINLWDVFKILLVFLEENSNNGILSFLVFLFGLMTDCGKLYPKSSVSFSNWAGHPVTSYIFQSSRFYKIFLCRVVERVLINYTNVALRPCRGLRRNTEVLVAEFDIQK